MCMRRTVHNRTITSMSKRGLLHHQAQRDMRHICNLLDDECYDVEIEPSLQPLQGEHYDEKSTITEDEARLDIKSNGL